MNFVAYCQLFTCICILYDVISMYLNVFGDFPKSPPYFGYNSAGQENPVLCIFRFRDLYGLKLTWIFLRIIIFQNMTIQSFGIKQTGSGGGKEDRWRTHPPGRATYALGLLEPPQPSIKVPRVSS